MLKKFFILLMIIVIVWSLSRCNSCPPYAVENPPFPTVYFLKSNDSFFLAKVDYYAEEGGLFHNDSCYSDIHIFKVVDSQLMPFKNLKIHGKCELNSYYFFNIIYPLSFPSDEYAVTWWKGCMINEPVKYSVSSVSGTIGGEKMFSKPWVIYHYLFRFGMDLFYFPYNRHQWNWDWCVPGYNCCTHGDCWELEPVSNDLNLDCKLPEKIEKAEMYVDPVSDVPYYFAFVTDGVDVFRFSIVEEEEKKYQCVFSHVVSVKGQYRRVFFAYPFFAGEETATSNSVGLDLIDIETGKKIHYSFSITSDTGWIETNKIWTLSGVFKFSKGVLITFSRENFEHHRYYGCPDHFTSTWYFESFEGSESVKKIKLKFPMGWFSLERSFGGMTQYGDYVYAIGELSSDLNLDEVKEHIFSWENDCEKLWRRNYSICRGGYNGEEFVWEKIGNVKFNCNLEW